MARSCSSSSRRRGSGTNRNIDWQKPRKISTRTLNTTCASLRTQERRCSGAGRFPQAHGEPSLPSVQGHRRLMDVQRAAGAVKKGFDVCCERTGRGGGAGSTCGMRMLDADYLLRTALPRKTKCIEADSPYPGRKSRRVFHFGSRAWMCHAGDQQQYGQGMPDFMLSVDKIQADPFAAPSRFHVVVPGAVAGFPAEAFSTKVRTSASIST